MNQDLNDQYILEQVTDGIFIAEANARIIYVNPAFCQLLGRARDEIIGGDMAAFFDTATGDGATVPFMGLSRGEARTLACSLIRPDGMTVPVEIAARMGPDCSLQGVVRQNPARTEGTQTPGDSGELLREILDNTPIALYKRNYRLDIYEYISPAITTITGYTPAEIHRLSSEEVSKMLHPEDKRRTRAELEALFAQGGGKCVLEYRFFHKDGRIRYARDVARIFTDPEGRPLWGIGSVQDVTETRLAEARAREQAETFRTLTENSIDVIMRFDREGRHLYASPAVEGETGIPAEKFIGRTHEELGFPPDICALAENAIHAVFAAGAMQRVEFKLPNGSYIDWVLMPEYDARGNVKSVITSSRNITARRQAEDALKRSEAFLHGIFAAAPLGIALARGRVISKVNQGLCRLTGYSEEELIGTPTRIFYFDSSEYERAGQALYRDDTQSMSWSVESTWRRKDGTAIDVLLNGTTTNAGEPGGDWALTAIDITERKHAEAAMKTLYDLSLSLNSNTDLQHGMDYILEAALRFRGIDCGGIYLADPASGALVLHAHRGLSPEFAAHISHYPPDSPNVRMAMTGMTYHGASGDIDLMTDEVIAKEQLRSLAIIPIMHRGDLIAMLKLASHSHDSIPPGTGISLEMMALQIGNALLRLRADAALRESEARYRTIFENTGTSMILIEPDMSISMVNNEFVRRTGYSREEVLGSFKWMELIHPDDLSFMVDQHLTRHRSPGLALPSYEFRYRTKSGEPRHALFTIAMLPDAGKSIASIIDITERKRAEERMESALGEKVILLKEVHHRVKNNMQVIVSLLGLQTSHISNERDRELVMDIENSVRSMALVHEKLYRSENFSEIDMREYVRDLLFHMFQCHAGISERVQSRMDVGAIRLNIEEAVPCGLLINELLSNAFKYAFPSDRAGAISVSLVMEGGSRILRVADDGVGLPMDTDFSRPGTLGLKLIGALTRQLGGRMEISRDGGTAYTIRF